MSCFHGLKEPNIFTLFINIPKYHMQNYEICRKITNFANKIGFSDMDYLPKDLAILVSSVIYLAVINVVAFFMYGLDKWKAKRSKWRIPEATLLGLAVLGGSIGAWLGMKVWHHKTLHKKFKFGVPAIIIVQIALIGYFLYK